MPQENNELKVLQQKADMLTDESLESTRRMRQMVLETQNVGVQSMEMLDDQRRKLENIENNQLKISSDIQNAEKNLTKMEKFCGLFSCCSSKNDAVNGDEYKKAFGENVVQDTKSHMTINKSSVQNNSPQIKRIINDAREDEMDENLNMVNSIVGNLKNMAVDMGNEVSKQNEQLDRINQKANINATRIQSAETRAKKLL